MTLKECKTSTTQHMCLVKLGTSSSPGIEPGTLDPRSRVLSTRPRRLSYLLMYFLGCLPSSLRMDNHMVSVTLVLKIVFFFLDKNAYKNF